MQQEPAPAGSLEPKQDSALPHTPTMPHPESLSEDHQPSPGHSLTEQATEEEFQFLRCQGCKAEAKCPKLLPCLHTLCSRCLEAQSTQCPICQAPWPQDADAPALDNIFFQSLQQRLSVYRQIVDPGATCTRCKEPADFWCFECEQLICSKCFEAHQWFVKHEVRPLSELRGQSVREFLDGKRKSNNIFCSNPNHRIPTLTSIYCRGCSKPLCCSCALLDSGHSDLKCDISVEIQQRQEELDATTQALQEQDCAFSAAQAQMHSAVSQMGRVRSDMEELIRSRVSQVMAYVRAQERELLEEVNTRYQREYKEIAGQLGRLDAVLQRIRTGSVLVQRMKLYASDQEVLDMHGFLREALGRLRQEQPQSLQAVVRTDSFDELKVRLQDLVSCITQETDAALPRRASPEATSTPRAPFDVDLDPGPRLIRSPWKTGLLMGVVRMPEEPQMVQAQALGLAENQPVAVVQSVPGAHPVPMYAYSIKDSSCRKEVSNTATPQKRKSCQTECPRKVIKLESEEEKEARLARSSLEQPSTSRAVSPPHLDGPPSPESPTVGNEVLPLNSNHETGDSGEAVSEERIVVISSSEDSDAENSHMEPTETAAPHPPPAHPLPRARGASHPCRASRLPSGTCRPPSWPPHHPTKQAVVPDAESPSQPARCQERTVIQRGISYLSRAQRVTRLRHIFHLPLKMYCTPMWTSTSPATTPATTPAITGHPNHPANPQECTTPLQRASGEPRRARRAGRPRGRSLRGSSRVTQWLNNFFSLPLSSVTPQFDASLRGGRAGGRVLRMLRAGISQDSDRTPMKNPQIQVPLEVSPNAFSPLRPPESPSTSSAPPQTSL
ncbi:protein PML isoform X4 [Pteropus vampyrus]|uniref:Protein PML n=1 Tax=Pteropus vampyrus TaxID=132908 RepID=A0A6P6BYK2_PTEVA|nr:protein PML isoform X4 [Pteropus vampyrus]